MDTQNCPCLRFHGSSSQLDSWFSYFIHRINYPFRSREKYTVDSLLSAARDNVVYVEAFMNHLEHPASLAEHLKVNNNKTSTKSILLPSFKI